MKFEYEGNFLGCARDRASPFVSTLVAADIPQATTIRIQFLVSGAIRYLECLGICTPYVTNSYRCEIFSSIGTGELVCTLEHPS